jgi:hypothetical protein
MHKQTQTVYSKNVFPNFFYYFHLFKRTLFKENTQTNILVIDKKKDSGSGLV